MRDRLSRVGELAPADAASIMLQVADALSFAHAHGVIHRDIKPDNVMLTEHHALVTDFGVAQAIGASGGGRDWATHGRVMWGTPAYMAPEQVRPGAEPDRRADMYSLGALGYEMLTGGPPLPPLLLGTDAILRPRSEPLGDIRSQRKGETELWVNRRPADSLRVGIMHI